MSSVFLLHEVIENPQRSEGAEEVSLIKADLAVESFSYTLRLGGACQELGTGTSYTTDKYRVLWLVQ